MSQSIRTRPSFEQGNLHAPLSVGELLVIVVQILFIPGILLEAFVDLNVFEDDLAEAVKVRHVNHLGVDELSHQSARAALIMDLHFAT
jgi:hypothetical protein